jgi:hypothetical protein
MKNSLFIVGFIVLFCACNGNKKENTIPENNTNTTTASSSDTTTNFFPVTTYLKGEIFGIKNGGVTPLRKITIGTKVDSSWIKMEELETVFAEFLTPIIDTANVKDLFTEKRFLDQTLDAFTFTYEPKNEKGLAFPFTHWDVYVDPETQKVRRIYLVKKEGADKELQLTWVSGKNCKIVTLVTQNGKTTIAKEDKTIWRFEE